MNINCNPLLQVNRFSPDRDYEGKQALERAAALITEGEVNIFEAAIKSGYTNMSHFAK